jgi:HEAT repeat protein
MLFRIAGNPFDSVSRETVAAYGALLARDARERAAALTRELSDSKALAGAAEDSVEKLLADHDAWSRASAVGALGQIGTRTGPLIKALRDESGTVREAAAAALGRMGAPGLPALSRQLDAKDPALRALAVAGLAQSPEPRAAELLARAFKDEDEGVRLTAIAAPAAFQPDLAAAKAGLRPELQRLSREDPSDSVRAAALSALAAIPEK